eukprot:gene11749-biopygen4738
MGLWRNNVGRVLAGSDWWGAGAGAATIRESVQWRYPTLQSRVAHSPGQVRRVGSGVLGDPLPHLVPSPSQQYTVHFFWGVYALSTACSVRPSVPQQLETCCACWARVLRSERKLSFSRKRQASGLPTGVHGDSADPRGDPTGALRSRIAVGASGTAVGTGSIAMGAVRVAVGAGRIAVGANRIAHGDPDNAHHDGVSSYPPPKRNS